MKDKSNSSIIAMIGFVLCLLITVPAFAQKSEDQVWIEPVAVVGGEQVFTPRSLARMTGEVLSIDDKTLVFTPANETESVQIASSRVVWIEPKFEDEATVKAVVAFRSGDKNASISPLLNAVTAGPAVWRAQWLSMHLWQAAFHESKYPAALELVKQIDARPLPPMILGGLPIQWSSERLPVSALDAANNLLAAVSTERNGSLATRLVAASWLLNESNNRMATETLRAITLQSERPALAQLATALLWKQTSPPDVIANQSDWNQRLAKMSLTLTPGPTFLAAERLEAAGRPEDALTKYLSVAIASPRPHATSASAKSRAISLLVELNRPAEAAKIEGTDNQSDSP
jgi:hypothetical protein